MKRAITVAVSVLTLMGISVADADAAGRCYWSEGCAQQCIDGYRNMGIVKRVPGRTCRKAWCCDQQAAKAADQDPGWRCRNIVCGNKRGIPYIQCMKKCK